ncbi:MAG: hypothetical protein U0941_28420 [Planctomycetaceae bacterium]
MKSLLQKLVRASLVAGFGLVATFNATAQESPGMVRITKPKTVEVQSAREVIQARFAHQSHGGGRSNCDCQASGSMTPSGCPHTGCPNGNCQFGNCQHGNCQFGGCQFGGCNGCCNGCCNQNGRAMAEYFRCKFGYFIPTGAGGAGVPLAGKYSRVYPQDPYYFDQRDGQAWGAQGYGIPMSVPLAPTVGHAYNYGWGSPSSRLTPISRPAY